MAKVWTCFYTHKHGHDICVYATEELAMKAALGLVQEYRADFNVPLDLTDEEALSQWAELTDGRGNIEIGGTSVITSLPGELDHG